MPFLHIKNKSQTCLLKWQRHTNVKPPRLSNSNCHNKIPTITPSQFWGWYKYADKYGLAEASHNVGSWDSWKANESRSRVGGHDERGKTGDLFAGFVKCHSKQFFQSMWGPSYDDFYSFQFISHNPFSVLSHLAACGLMDNSLDQWAMTSSYKPQGVVAMVGSKEKHTASISSVKDLGWKRP